MCTILYTHFLGWEGERKEVIVNDSHENTNAAQNATPSTHQNHIAHKQPSTPRPDGKQTGRLPGLLPAPSRTHMRWMDRCNPGVEHHNPCSDQTLLDWSQLTNRFSEGKHDIYDDLKASLISFAYFSLMALRLTFDVAVTRPYNNC